MGFANSATPAHAIIDQFSVLTKTIPTAQHAMTQLTSRYIS
jgi:hypothetical protein